MGLHLFLSKAGGGNYEFNSVAPNLCGAEALPCCLTASLVSPLSRGQLLNKKVCTMMKFFGYFSDVTL